MKRGVIFLTNLELIALHSMVVEQNCVKQDLMQKLSPLGLGSIDTNPDINTDNVEDNKLQLVQIQITEDDAETLLDCMPIFNEESNLNLISARAKIQQFLFH